MAERDRAGLSAVGGGDSPGAPGDGDVELSSGEWTAADGRKFAWTVGGLFLVVGGLFWWRGHPLVAGVAAAVGAPLAAAGAVVPRRLRPLYGRWMALARAISKVTTPIVLSIVYFLVMTPAGLLRRTLGRDPLRRSDDGNSYWKRREDGGRSDLRRQF